MDDAANDIILVDASMSGQEDPKTLIKRTTEKTDHTGYGGMHIIKNNNKIKGYFHNTINSNDAQAAKLQGIATAVEIAEQIPNENLTNSCDCKNAVKDSNNKCKTPFKYAKPAQQK